MIAAAHFIHGFTRWRVGVGSTNVAQLLFHSTTVAAVAPTFDPKTRHDDIGIITLPTSLIFTSNLGSIALPPLSTEISLVHLPY